MSDHSTHSARLHALAAALCALLLLVALGIMDANRAPWWALLATQGALLVTTASSGIWLDRSVAFGVRRSACGRGGQEDGRRERAVRVAGTPPRLPGWTQGDARAQDGWSAEMWQRHGLPGVLRVTDEERVFWQERAHAEAEEEDHGR